MNEKPSHHLTELISPEAREQIKSDLTDYLESKEQKNRSQIERLYDKVKDKGLLFAF